MVNFIPVIKAEFIIITPVFSVTWSFTNHSNRRIWWSTNIYDYYQFSKPLIFLWKPYNAFFFQDSLEVHETKSFVAS